jgi:hypothetical protein
MKQLQLLLLLLLLPLPLSLSRYCRYYCCLNFFGPERALHAGFNPWCSRGRSPCLFFWLLLLRLLLLLKLGRRGL